MMVWMLLCRKMFMNILQAWFSTMMFGFYIMAFHRMLMNCFVWGFLVCMFLRMLLMLIVLVQMVLTMAYRWMIIAKPEFVTISRIMVSKRSKRKLRCVIVVTRV